MTARPCGHPHPMAGTGAVGEREMETVTRLMDRLEDMSFLIPETDEDFVSAVLLRQPAGSGDFLRLCRDIVLDLAALEPALGLVPLVAPTGRAASLFADSLLAALWKLQFPTMAQLQPDAAKALQDSPTARVHVLNFLSAELAAARINCAADHDPDSSGVLLQSIANAMGMAPMEAGTAPDAAVGSIVDAIEKAVAATPAGLGDTLLPPGSLDAGAIETLGQINELMRADYDMRRRLLLKRFEVRSPVSPPLSIPPGRAVPRAHSCSLPPRTSLVVSRRVSSVHRASSCWAAELPPRGYQVTLQSFLYSKKLEGRTCEVEAELNELQRDFIRPAAQIDLAHVFAAPLSTARVTKTNSQVANDTALLSSLLSFLSPCIVPQL